MIFNSRQVTGRKATHGMVHQVEAGAEAASVDRVRAEVEDWEAGKVEAPRQLQISVEKHRSVMKHLLPEAASYHQVASFVS